MYLVIFILLILFALVNPAIVLMRKIRKRTAPPITTQTKIKGHIFKVFWNTGQILLFAVLCVYAGIGLYDIGFREIIQAYNIWFTAVVIILCVLLILSLTSTLFLYLFLPAARKNEMDRRERGWMLLSALPAAVCGEFVMRGMLFYVMHTLFPSMPLPVLLGCAVLIDVLKNANYEIRGIVTHLFASIFLWALFLVTGSIIPAMVMRFLGNVSNAFPLADSPALPEAETQDDTVHTELIEGKEYTRKAIDMSERTEKTAPTAFTIAVAVLSLVLLHVVFPQSIPALLEDWISQFRIIHIFIFIGLVALNFVCTGVHELLHAVFFAPFQRNGFASTRISSNLMGFFCETKEPIKVGQYIIGLVAPTLIMGIIPLIIGVVTGNVFLLLFGGWMTIGGNGDFMILLGVMKYPGSTWLLIAAAEHEIYFYEAITPTR
ncbi:MAG: DUF3267 domain-containing protein [Defluviitaleaceae bacterium]|nr:DUF3267 domain-containing protein [Defluviitaleaceae bacterium]MCL2274522.1 DUF3267 domain-containing protein [Defluviitaleaceae bacterium]